MSMRVNQRFTPLGPYPSRREPQAVYEPKADNYLSALPKHSQEMETIRVQFNAALDEFNARHSAADSDLHSLRGEVDGARLGHSTLALAMQDLSQRMQDLVEVQNAISMGQVAVSVGRVPSPNDDVYPPGYTWVYPGTDNFWVCVGVAPGAARWRRSDGELTRRLVKPTVQMSGSAGTFQEVTIALGNADSERLEVEWDATGSPAVISGDLSGSDSAAITLQWAGAGEYTVRARVRGDGTVLHHSFWSDIRAVLVGPSIFCGSGAYCGDGSHAGAMIS
jgi:hypothetical protein